MADTKLGKQVAKTNARLDLICQQSRSLVTTIRSALDSCSTVKQLQDNYGDLTKYIPAPEPSTKPLAITSDVVANCLNNLKCTG